jgi:periplasmic binding protein and sugar binding domain of the lacI family protein
LGIILPNLRNPFFETVVSYLSVAAERVGWLPLVGTASDDTRHEEAVLRRFREFRAVGVIVVSPVGDLESLAALSGPTSPLVLLGAENQSGVVPCVHVDEDTAAQLIVEHLGSQGVRRVVSLAEECGSGMVWVLRRRAALIAACQSAGIECVPAIVERGEAVAPILARFIDDAQTDVGVVAHNDVVALDALSVLRSVGLESRRWIPVVGFDDTHLASRPEFDLTSVNQQPGALVDVALDMVAGAVRGLDHTVEPRLVVRSSSKR